MYRKAIAGLALVFLLGACGRDTTSKTANIAQEKIETPLFIVMGGFNSCADRSAWRSLRIFDPSPYDTDLYPPFLEIKNQLTSAYGVESRFIITCFTLRNKTIQVVSSTAPQTVHKMTLPEFYTFVDNEAHLSLNATPVYIIGHSHGGWLSMKLATELSDDVELRRIESLDAISYQNCTAASFINWGSREPNPDCLQSPTDLDASDLERAASRVRSWTNTFQTQSRYLHSTEVVQASENMLLDMPATLPFGIDAHLDIDNDVRLWEAIKVRVYSDF